MTTRLELLNKVARLARLSDDQIRALGLEFDARITRFLSRKRQYVYVVIIVPLNPEGFPKWDAVERHCAVFEARRMDGVYAAGQKKFNVMRTNQQEFFDVVLSLEE